MLSLARLCRPLPPLSHTLTRPILHPRHVTTTTTPPQPPPSSTHNPPDDLSRLHAAVLLHVPTHGWTNESIAAAVRSLNWSPAATRMFPRGIADVLHTYTATCNRQLATHLSADPDAAQGRTRAGRAAYAIRTRIDMAERFHQTWAQALALQARPAEAGRVTRGKAMVVDEVAHFAGYRDPDFSWYTDRAVLGLAYQATELYWLTDRSPGREETWRFLEMRLEDSEQLRVRASSTLGSVMSVSDAAVSSLSTLIQSTRRSY